MRIFIAILFSPAVKSKVSDIMEKLKEKNYHGQFTAHDNLHITLHYLGETKKEKLIEVIQQLQKIYLEPFTIQTNHLDTFGNGQRKKVLYLGLKKNKKLMDLHKIVIKQLNSIGYDIDHHSYTPHITLMKKLVIDDKAIEKIKFKAFEIEVNSISVMESKRCDGNLVYQEIKNIPLKK
ncbi:MAG: RNA 2',3'-cyclic phosphodiesterase [Candidatus Izemoplasmatales bacterium]